jgi:hypothetical protein
MDSSFEETIDQRSWPVIDRCAEYLGAELLEATCQFQPKKLRPANSKTVNNLKKSDWHARESEALRPDNLFSNRTNTPRLQRAVSQFSIPNVEDVLEVDAAGDVGEATATGWAVGAAIGGASSKPSLRPALMVAISIVSTPSSPMRFLQRVRLAGSIGD